MCDKCKVIHREGVVRVICTNPKHKQRQVNRVRGNAKTCTTGRRRFTGKKSGPRSVSPTFMHRPHAQQIAVLPRRRQPDKKVADLTEDEVNRIRLILEAEGSVEGDLRKEISMNIKRLIEMGAYRGLRHRRGLPVRASEPHQRAHPQGSAARHRG